MSESVIRDVVKRTNGELYIGVVGAVRSGKSMFIRKFMQMKVVPYVLTEDEKNKIVDELPQSAEGKTIMTVEPKFVPSSIANILVDDDLNLCVRMVDCVGYVINTSKGYLDEDGSPRLVKTPWFNENIPFFEAATIGTKKVIENHSHIGILMTSDGSFGEFTRADYESVEQELVDEMKAINKPFVIVVNSSMPGTSETMALVDKLKDKYDVSVISIDVANMSESDIDNILKNALSEYDIAKLDINVPAWLNSLNDDNETKCYFNEVISSTTGQYRKFKHVEEIKNKLSECDLFDSVVISSLDSGTGEVQIEITPKEELYDNVVKEIVGAEVLSDRLEFLKFVQEAKIAKLEYDNIKVAIETVKATGYGISIPKVDDMILDTPEVIKQGSRYGVKLRAIAPSIHMIKVDVESSFEPIIGSLEQSKQLIDKLMQDYENNPTEIWNSEIFGRKLSEVVNDGIKAKLYLIPEVAQQKFKESLEKVVNKGKGGILAFVL